MRNAQLLGLFTRERTKRDQAQDCAKLPNQNFQNEGQDTCRMHLENNGQKWGAKNARLPGVFSRERDERDRA